MCSRNLPENTLKRMIEHNTELATHGYLRARGAVKRVLKQRNREWSTMQSGSIQEQLLRGQNGLRQLGVIYAISLGNRLYVGQTVNHALHRACQHATSSARPQPPQFEQLLARRIAETPSWAEDLIVLPLEHIPMPSEQRLGHHTTEFIQTFRARALAREQHWIKVLRTRAPDGLNTDYRAPNPANNRRRTQRTCAPKQTETRAKPQTRRRARSQLQNAGNPRRQSNRSPSLSGLPISSDSWMASSKYPAEKDRAAGHVVFCIGS